ncbi:MULTISPECIES: DoxX family protein [Halorussus]|uniref:DoxX family protein n=1 Tax=Halorussus TaxID=1070314 RepID=UPI0034A545F0
MALLGSDANDRDSGQNSEHSNVETEQGVSPVTADPRERPPRTQSKSFKLARLLFGGLLAFMAIDNFRNLDAQIGYAESKGVSNAELSVPLASGALLFGGLGIATWKLPRLAAGAVATFFLGVTPRMHDFWEADEEMEKQNETYHFLKNASMLGAALAFLRIAQDDRRQKSRR